MIISDENVFHFIENHGWDWCSEYGEPGYQNFGTSFVVLGSYWCRCGKHPHAGRQQYNGYGTGKIIEPGEMHSYEDHHPRLWAQLESQGVQFEWHDEWVIDRDHDDAKAYRMHADSYDWQPSAVWSDDDVLLTPDSTIEEWIDGYCANNPRRCLPRRVYSGADLEAIGFVKHNGQFESGWHEGQDANPIEIHAAIRAQHPDDTIVFALDYASQFYSGFSAYHRPPQEDE